MDAHRANDAELPFTEEEFYAAFRLLHSEAEAREVASYISSVVRDTARRSEAAKSARARGSIDPHEIAEPTWVIGDEAFALLSFVSEALRKRVDVYIEARWEAERPALTRSVMYQHRRSMVGEATAAESAEVDAQIAAYAREWNKIRTRVQRRVQRRRRAGSTDQPPN